MRARIYTLLILAWFIVPPSGGAFAQDAIHPTVDLGSAAQPPSAPISEFSTQDSELRTPSKHSDAHGTEILYIPRADLPRAPGYAAQGITLPLSDLLALTRAAQTPDTVTSRPLSLVCRALILRGQISGSTAMLQGELEYEAVDPGWTATAIDDASIGWVNQSAPSGSEVFLVRAKGRTMLLARGPAQGRLGVNAIVPLTSTSGSLSVDFGRIVAPCRIEMNLGGRLLPDSANAPLKTQVNDTDSSITLWPGQGKSASLYLKRRPALAGMSPVKLELSRRVRVVGAGLEVHDELLFTGRLAGTWSLNIPKGLRPLNVSASGDARVALENIGDGNRLRVRRNADSTSLALTIDSVAPLSGGSATLNPYAGPWDAEVSMLDLVSSSQLVPVPDTPPGLIATGGSEQHRTYTAWGSIPAFAIRLTPSQPSIPPSIAQNLEIDANEARLNVDIRTSDPRRNAYSIEIPVDWVPLEFRAGPGDSTIPLTIQQRDSRLWRVSWDPAFTPESLHISLHRSGAWGAPGKSTSIALPLIGLDGPRPTAHDMTVRWMPSLDVQPVGLQGIKVTPTQIDIQSEGKPVNLTLRVTARNPAGSLSIGGREPNIRATVVTALAIEEDRPHVRALINYDVRLAPTHTFRVLLPSGAGNAVRIQNDAIRESTMRPTAQGDEWTVVTQHDVLGRYALQIEWSLESSKTGIEAPQIRVPGVTSQEGFIVLEGSETLRLAIETANLVETDMSEVPPLPWPRRNRTLAAFRYVAPPFSLRVKAEKFTPEPALAGLVHDARLVTTVSSGGQRLTEANYVYAPRGGSQYFDARLPAGANLWAVRVNDQGVHPSRRADSAGQWLMVPLDSALAPSASATPRVSILYSEEGASLAAGTRLALDAPKLKEPILRTQWDLNLPPQFEYLTYGGTLINTTQTRVPFANYMRTAYYPRRILFPDMGIWAIAILTGVGIGGVLLIRYAMRRAKQKKPAVPFGIIQLTIVAAIIAVLAAIATPNFLEAQSRSRVSRVMSDQRTIAVAIESYFVDAGRYPAHMDELWQGTVKYMSNPINDPFALMAGKGGASYHYAEGIDAWNRVTQAGINVGPPTEKFWLIWSDGPDMRDDNAMVIYDATNGTASGGDVFRFNSGVAQAPQGPGWEAAQGMVSSSNVYSKDGEMQEEKKDLNGARKSNEAPKGSLSDRQAGRNTLRAGEARDERGATGAKPSPTAPAVSDLPDVAMGNGETGMADDLVGPLATKRTDAGLFTGNLRINKTLALVPPQRSGLLSMKIDIPVGGVQRTFEALGAENQLRLRLMDYDRYRHLSLIVWMAAFLAMGAVWMRRRGLYRRVFVLAVAFFILTPVVFGGAWVVFFNRALEGVLLSLAIPLVARLWRGLTRHGDAVTTALILGIVLSFAATPARAADSPVRIVVPYDEQGPDLTGNPSAFMSREDFTRLWLAASKTSPRGVTGRPAIARLELEGALDPAAGVVAGTVRIYAVNTGDRAGTATLALNELEFESVQSSSPGAALQASSNGLVLNLAAHWAGSLNARFKLPCPARGLDGRLRLTFPETGSGAWRIRIPFAGAVGTGRGTITQSAEGATDFSGAVRPGPLDFSWRGTRNRSASARTVAGGWRMSFDTTLRWDDLAAAQWQSRVQLQAIGSEGRLPRQVQLQLGPGQKISSAVGEALTGAAVTSQTLTLMLTESADATIDLGGLLLPVNAKWQAAGPRPIGAVESTQAVRLEFAEDIDVTAVEQRGLRRIPTLKTTPGTSAQQYESSAPAWSANVELQRRPALFDVRTTLYLRPADGSIDETALVRLAPAASSLQECRIELPAGSRALKVEGAAVAGWIQTGRSILVRFDPPVESPCTLGISAIADLPTTGSELLIEPVRVAGARQARHWAVVQVEPDENLADIDLAGSRPCAPGDIAAELTQINSNWTSIRDSLRAYELIGTDPVRLGRAPVQASARVTVLNRITVANGLRSLTAVVRTEPRRGRVSRIETLLMLDRPDPGAPQRVQTSGPARHVSFEPAPGGLRVATELDAPHADAVEVRFELDQPVSTESGTSIGLTAMIPTGEGDRAFVLLRRAFEGHLDMTDAAASRRIDPTGAPWPADFQILPTDQTIELTPARHTAPRFQVVRHSRTEALRAVVDALRQRTIVTADGVERHELRIVLQNQAEQFLRVELPYPRREIDIYEVQAAGRVIEPIFEPGGKSVLLLPLIRTGLLVPELTINIAYIARTGNEMGRGGSHAVALPKVLGNVPVLQSSLVLMLPTDYSYSDFKGSLERVELIDIENTENLRYQRRLAQISEAALYTKGETRQQVLGSLSKMQTEATMQMRQNQFTNDAFARQSVKFKGSAGQRPIEDDKLLRERNFNLEQASISNRAIASNIELNMRQEQQAQQGERAQQMAVAPQQTPAAAPTSTPQPLSFASMGEVFAFRQLQGVGDARFDYSAREIGEHRRDFGFALTLVLLAAALTYASGWLLATPRRIVWLVLIVCVIAILSRAALDATIPGAAACALALRLLRRKPPVIEQPPIAPPPDPPEPDTL